MNKNFNKVRREILRIYKSTDARLKHVIKVCSSGCSHCCYQNIPVHAAEECAITKYVEQEFSAELKKELSARLRGWLRFMNEYTPNLPELSPEDIRIFGEKLIQHKVHCPFLVENQCSIYPVRPITCRTFYVSDSPDICESNPGRIGEMYGYKIQLQGLQDIERVSDFWQMRLLPYAVADYFGVLDEIKRSISSYVLSSMVNKNA